MLRFTRLKYPAQAIDRSSRFLSLSKGLQNTSQTLRRTRYLHSIASRPSVVSLRQRQAIPSCAVQSSDTSLTRLAFPKKSLHTRRFQQLFEVWRKLWNFGQEPKEQSEQSEQAEHGDNWETIRDTTVTGSSDSFTDEQHNILDIVLNKKENIFFTGPAGTGKSFLLRKIINALLVRGEAIAVTASTGIAASHIGGKTLHSFAGIGLGVGTVHELVSNIASNRHKKAQWTETQVLIIDEVSMIHPDFFDKLEKIARIVRRNNSPFGGLQLVITGDFFQLPPVSPGSIPKFAFEAKSWSEVIDHTIGLSRIFRQTDPIFTGMLNEMREARLSPKSTQRFEALSRPLKIKDGLVPSELFPLRAQVDMANRLRLEKLPGDVHTYNCQDWGLKDMKARDQLLANCIAPEVLMLKKDAQVMLTKNNTSLGLVNGSLGQVMGFMGDFMYKEYRRVLETEWLDSGVPEHYDGSDDDEQKYPVVRFVRTDGTRAVLHCIPSEWTVEECLRTKSTKKPRTITLASRTQVPLILAWALSIHKAQGQTLSFVKVDLGRVFEKGQAYVALSRATDMHGLQVLNFDPGKVRAHEKVRAFYKTLSVSSTPKAEESRWLSRVERWWKVKR